MRRLDSNSGRMRKNLSPPTKEAVSSADGRSACPSFSWTRVHQTYPLLSRGVFDFDVVLVSLDDALQNGDTILALAARDNDRSNP